MSSRGSRCSAATTGARRPSAVAGADLRLLSELVSKSLVRRSDFGRYELHELLRQYAAERLAASPGEERDAREQHARHYAAMLTERQAALMGPELAVARDELRGELDNLRAAAEWIVAEDDEHVALPVLEAFYTFLWMHSWFDGAETLELLGRTAGFDADDPASASAVALAAAMYRIAIGARLGYDPAAEELAVRCLPVLRARNTGARARKLPVRARHHGGVSRRLPGRGRVLRRRGGRSRERSATGSPRAGL